MFGGFFPGMRNQLGGFTQLSLSLPAGREPPRGALGPGGRARDRRGQAEGHI